MNETTVIEQFLCTAIFRIPKMKVTSESRFGRNLSSDTGALQYLHFFYFAVTLFVDDFDVLRIIYPRDYDVHLSP